MDRNFVEKGLKINSIMDNAYIDILLLKDVHIPRLIKLESPSSN